MRLLKQNIDTYLGLGHLKQNTQENYDLALKRAMKTVEFVVSNKIPCETAVDIAGPSIVGKWILEVLNCGYWEGTKGDLDREWLCDLHRCDLVLMTEVIEHLLNPLKFMEELAQRVEFKSMVLTWPARPSWLWTEGHFHEMRLDRFELLCKMAGYEIIEVKKGTAPETWYNRFRGIRPFFRSFVQTHYMAHLKLM